MNDISIIEYLPPFLQEYLQYKLLMYTEDIEFQNIFINLNKIEQNQFIFSLDDEGLKRFEKMLNIYSQSNESMEIRRMKVLSKWNEHEVYTFDFLKSKLDVICGKENYDIIEDFKNYRLEIHTYLSEIGEVTELERVIDSIIPCNLVVVIKNNIICKAKGKKVFSGAVNIVEEFNCSSKT